MWGEATWAVCQGRGRVGGESTGFVPRRGFVRPRQARGAGRRARGGLFGPQIDSSSSCVPLGRVGALSRAHEVDSVDASCEGLS